MRQHFKQLIPLFVSTACLNTTVLSFVNSFFRFFFFYFFLEAIKKGLHSFAAKFKIEMRDNFTRNNVMRTHSDFNQIAFYRFRWIEKPTKSSLQRNGKRQNKSNCHKENAAEEAAEVAEEKNEVAKLYDFETNKSE